MASAAGETNVPRDRAAASAHQHGSPARRAMIAMMSAEQSRIRRETRVPPIALALTGAGAGAALFAAVAAFIELVG